MSQISKELLAVTLQLHPNQPGLPITDNADLKGSISHCPSLHRGEIVSLLKTIYSALQAEHPVTE